MSKKNYMLFACGGITLDIDYWIVKKRRDNFLHYFYTIRNQ